MTQKFSNAARAQLLSTMNSTDAVLFLENSGEKFPYLDPANGDFINLTLDDGEGNIEVIKCFGHLATEPNTFTHIIRAQEGTSAREWIAGTVVGLRLTANDMAVVHTALNNVSDTLIQLNTLKVDKENGKALSKNDFTDTLKSKLEGIATGAQVNVPTNLTVGTITTTTVNLNSSTGSSATLPEATPTSAGVMTATDKLDLANSIKQAATQEIGGSKGFTNGVNFRKGIDLCGTGGNSGASAYYGSRCIAVSTDTAKFGGLYDDHSAFLIHAYMGAGWGSGEIRFVIATGAGAYNTAAPAASISESALLVKGNIIGYTSSDRKLKKNIKSIKNALDKVRYIGGYTFDWKGRKPVTEEDHYYRPVNDFGVIAQDVQEVFPIAVKKRLGGETLAVDYEKLVALAFQAIKELEARVAELEETNDNPNK